MENTARLLVTAIIAIVIAATADAMPVGAPGAWPHQAAMTRQTRLVCDQNCRCWHTAYRQRRRDGQALDSQDPNDCPAGGHYNGYYRSGPSVGLSFESRFPARWFPF